MFSKFKKLASLASTTLASASGKAKLFGISFYNWIFNVQMITTSNIDLRGFNVYEYEASPTGDKGMYLVTFRHTLNGIQENYWACLMPEKDWIATRERLMQSGRYAF